MLAGSAEADNNMIQLYDCTCSGYVQTYQCTVLGAGTTIWQGSAFNCSQAQNKIELRHSEYKSPQRATGQCNDRAVEAESAGIVNNCHVSLLNVTVGEEMDGETIECVHRDIESNTTQIGEIRLDITQGINRNIVYYYDS